LIDDSPQKNMFHVAVVTARCNGVLAKVTAVSTAVVVANVAFATAVIVAITLIAC